jgi:hypothetical protein
LNAIRPDTFPGGPSPKAAQDDGLFELSIKEPDE